MLTASNFGSWEVSGWEVLGLPPSVESIVLIAPDGRSVIAESHEDIGEVSLPLLPSD